jgi:hypothetical protein
MKNEYIRIGVGEDGGEGNRSMVSYYTYNSLWRSEKDMLKTMRREKKIVVAICLVCLSRMAPALCSLPTYVEMYTIECTQNAEAVDESLLHTKTADSLNYYHTYSET